MSDVHVTNKGSILVVDDTAASLKLLMDTLVTEGYEVRPANSGELALASIASRPPELILLDIRMPGLDGLEVCRRLKAREETRDIPILFLSAVADVAARVEGFQRGAVDFISKPFQRDELLARVQTHLERSRMRAQLTRQAADLRLANERLQRELVERTQAEQALRARTHQLDAIGVVSAEITRELDLTRLLQLILRRAAGLLGAKAGFVSLYDETTQTLIPRASEGHGDWVGDLRFPLGEGISGMVAERRQGMVVNDYRTSSHTLPLILAHTNCTSVVAEPLLYRDRLVGVVTVDNQGTEERRFVEEDRELLALFATQAAVAIQNARLYEAAQRELADRRQAEATLEQRTRQLDAVRMVGEEITRELELPRVLELITHRAVELVGARSGILRLWDEEQQLLESAVWTGVASEVPTVDLRLGEGVAGEAARRREGFYDNDFRRSRYAIPALLDGSMHTAVMAVPLVYRDRLVGVLSITRNATDPLFAATDLEALRLFAPQAAIAIENARLYEAAQREVVERTRAEKALATAQEELIRAEKLRALGQMAAGVAHDLNNMLAAILGQAELLRIRVKLPEVQEALQVLYTAASDGAQVVRRLQEFGRQQPTTPLLPCDLAPIVHEALELTRPRWQDEAQRQGRAIQVHTALDGLPRILGHPAELREALTNLILNAVDAMPTGGWLTLAGYPDTASPVSVDRAAVCLTVTDTGTGMPEEVRRHIFDPFYTTKGVRGTGLGLAVVYGILERHGGHIDVTSTPGRGTTFTLRLQTPPSDLSTAPTAGPARATAARRILLIDDEAPVRGTIADLLRAVGHDITEAESGTAGLASLAAQAVDLVITDLGMPEMTGWEVAQRVKVLCPTLPVLLLTGWGQQISDTAPGHAYVDSVLAKPIRLEDLQATIGGLPFPERSPCNGG